MSCGGFDQAMEASFVASAVGTGLDVLGLLSSLEQVLEPSSRSAVGSLIVELHDTNAQLWDAEDSARDASGDARLASAKRAIDRLNLERSGLVEKIDDVVSRHLPNSDHFSRASVPTHTETIGSILDRLTILVLRLERTRAAALDDAALNGRVAFLDSQHGELASALDALIGEVAAGTRLLPDGRRFKLYGTQRSDLQREQLSTEV